ncbi:PucR family transcriptional regulator [Nocardioides zeae]
MRLAIDVVEANVEPLLEPVDRAAVHAGVLHYGRELAFATARVYARAAELRGAWDARLEALVVDSVVRGDADAEVLSRASALGWGQGRGVCVVVGDVPTSRSAPDLVGEVRRRALTSVSDVLCAIQGHRLVVVLGGVGREAPEGDVEGPGVLAAAATVLAQFDEGAVVVGPWVEDLAAAHVSAREAVAAHEVAAAWPDAPRPVHALDLLPERLLAGERGAGAQLLDHVHRPLAEHRSALVQTLTTFFAQRSSIEATARALFVHPNTVRYRLAQVAEVTGCTPTDPGTASRSRSRSRWAVRARGSRCRPSSSPVLEGLHKGAPLNFVRGAREWWEHHKAQ